MYYFVIGFKLFLNCILKDINLQQRDQSLEEMKKEKNPVSFDDKKKDFVSKLSRLSIDNNVFEGSTDLPQVFQV